MYAGDIDGTREDPTTMSGAETSGSSRGFTYLLIPADPECTVLELEGERLRYAGDALPEALRSRFANRAGAGSPASLDDKTARILAASDGGKTETFALVHPAATNGNRGVYMYTDEVGKLRGLPENPRAGDLADRCGLARDGAFHGDAFVGAVITHPEVTNVSFTADELHPDAPWLVAAPAENAAYAHTMREFMSAVRAKSVSDEDRARILADRAEASGRGDPRDVRADPEPDEPPNHGLESREGLEPYFARVIADADDAPVEAKRVPGAGFGLFAARRLKRFDVLWTEAPLVSTQTPENAAEVLACAWCHRSIGDLDAQLSLAAGACSADEAAASAAKTAKTRGEGGGGDDDETDKKDENEDAKLVAAAERTRRAREGWSTVAWDRAGTCAALREAEGIAPAVPCRRRGARGCWAWYCSTTCRARHAKNGHDARCGARNPSAEQAAPPSEGASAEAVAAAAANAFRRHCGRHDDLALFAEAAGGVAAKIARGEDWETATTPLRAFCSAPWWEVSAESGEGGVDAETLRAVAARAVGLLRASAVAAVRAVDEEIAAMDAATKTDADADADARDAAEASRATLAALPEVLDRLGVDGAGRILGAFDLNQWSIKIDHPMRNVCRKLLWIDEYEGADAAAGTLGALLPIAIRAQDKRDAEDEAAGRPRWGGEDTYEDDEDEDEKSDDAADSGEIRLDETADAEDLYDVSRRLFPMFAGEGLFSLLCVVNHACEPSVVTRYRSWKGATIMRVEALRDIEAGEELTVSYVDETEPLAARRAALASYRFECRCAKCERESREEAVNRARGVADDVD